MSKTQDSSLRDLFTNLSGGECFLLKIPRRLHADLEEARQNEGRETVLGDLVVGSQDGKGTVIELHKGYTVVFNSVEDTTRQGDETGQGRMAVKEAEKYDWDREEQVQKLEVMAPFEFEVVTSLGV